METYSGTEQFVCEGPPSKILPARKFSGDGVHRQPITYMECYNLWLELLKHGLIWRIGKGDRSEFGVIIEFQEA
jgi:hypothetical protein